MKINDKIWELSVFMLLLLLLIIVEAILPLCLKSSGTCYMPYFYQALVVVSYCVLWIFTETLSTNLKDAKSCVIREWTWLLYIYTFLAVCLRLRYMYMYLISFFEIFLALEVNFFPEVIWIFFSFWLVQSCTYLYEKRFMLEIF